MKNHQNTIQKYFTIVTVRGWGETTSLFAHHEVLRAHGIPSTHAFTHSGRWCTQDCATHDNYPSTATNRLHNIGTSVVWFDAPVCYCVFCKLKTASGEHFNTSLHSWPPLTHTHAAHVCWVWQAHRVSGLLHFVTQLPSIHRKLGLCGGAVVSGGVRFFSHWQRDTAQPATTCWHLAYNFPAVSVVTIPLNCVMVPEE